jgi:putative hydrolase of the HAD superfamily
MILNRVTDDFEMSRMTIRCITFDLDDTLWECWPTIRRAERTLFQWLQVHYPRITERYNPEELYAHRMAYTKAHPELHHHLTQIRKNWLALLANELDYKHEAVAVSEKGFQVFWQTRNEVTFFDGVQTLLLNLKKDYMLGAITNGNADVDYIGVGHLFDFSIKAEDAGVAKPDPAIFQLAIDKANVAVESMLHVGDDPIGDIQGAQAIGMKTVWANYAQKEWQESHQPDATVHYVTDLDATIRRFS